VDDGVQRVPAGTVPVGAVKEKDPAKRGELQEGNDALKMHPHY
jgi:hypothetical protein